MSRAAAEIEPVSRMLSRSLAFPGPMRAPDSKTMLTLSRAMPAQCHASRFESRSFLRAGWGTGRAAACCKVNLAV